MYAWKFKIFSAVTNLLIGPIYWRYKLDLFSNVISAVNSPLSTTKQILSSFQKYTTAQFWNIQICSICALSLLWQVRGVLSVGDPRNRWGVCLSKIHRGILRCLFKQNTRLCFWGKIHGGLFEQNIKLYLCFVLLCFVLFCLLMQSRLWYFWGTACGVLLKQNNSGIFKANRKAVFFQSSLAV